jgi:hypothetical protein
MTTKAKATPSPKKVTPAKQSPKPAKAEAKIPELNIKPVKSGECTSLAETGVISYQIGLDEAGVTHYQITANNAGGFWSKEWVSWPAIYSACEGHTEFTSILLRGLFKGKSVNTAGFLLAALMDQGLIQRKAGKSRCYMLTEAAHKKGPTNAA